MPAGRPMAFATVEELQQGIDGKVAWIGKRLRNSDFDSEADLERFLCDNIAKFCESIGETYLSHETNKPISPQTARMPRGRRVDLFVKCADCDLIVELKNPSSGTESRAAIGQILDYGREFPYSVKKQLIIVSTQFDWPTAKTIKHYNLPVRYFYMSKRQTMEYLGDGKDRQAA